ncbi:MAG TPA: hypothetical protein ENK96_11010 [Desulfobulbaceae bacterium]|nr:hypothetical protein [Desulfobulbaceae bacterium]
MSDDIVNGFHTDLRKSKGKFAVFLGAGSSYDYGIPTMDEMAQILRQQVINKNEDTDFTPETLGLLAAIAGINQEKQQESTWNIEELLTRIHQVADALNCKNQSFAALDTKIGETTFKLEQINVAENELINFMANLAQLKVLKKKGISHGDGSIKYISEFIELMGTFQKTIRIFTTNIDLCVEAAIVRISQNPKGSRADRFHLIDGFSSGTIPVFNIANFAWKPADPHPDTALVYYWELHGSVDWTYSMPFDGNDGNTSVEFNDDAIICKRIPDDQWQILYECGALATKETAKTQNVVIFPTPAKYLQTYTNPYMDLYEAFRRTLEEAELLLVVGTSFPDQHIKSVIRNFIQRKNTLLYVVDPQLSRENLISILGNSDAIQDVISFGFRDFVHKLKEAENTGPSGKASANE